MAAYMAMWEYLTGIMGDTFYQSPSQNGCAIILSGHRGIQPVESDVATMQDILLVDFIESAQCSHLIFSKICDEFSGSSKAAAPSHFPQALKTLKHHCVD
jgi:hypothetical protein